MWHHQIDKLIYINLDYRTDRNKEVLEQINKIGFPMEKVIRYEATKLSYPPSGCSFSHANVLKMAYELNLNNVLILEDDCSFIDHLSTINNTMNAFFNIENWDGLLLLESNQLSEPYNDHFNICLKSSNAVGYLVSRKIMLPLSETIRKGGEKLLETGAHWIYANDVVWTEYMKNKTWFSPTTSLCYQRPSRSDLVVDDYYSLYPNIKKLALIK